MPPEPGQQASDEDVETSRGASLKVTRPGQTWLAAVAIVLGAVMAVWWRSAAHVANLPRYAYGDRGDPSTPVPAWVTDVQHKLPAALPAQIWVLVGCGLALLGFAWIFRIWSISLFGRTVAAYVLAAIAIMVTAGIAEGGLLGLTLRSTPNPATLIVATAATTTVKWCAVLPAIGGIPATIGIAGRAFAAWFRTHSRKQPANRPQGRPWWDHVLAEPEPPTTGVEVREQQGSWVDAYNVPGAGKVLEARNGKAVQGICLSGGGVRSACVAMGVTQIFSEHDPIDPGKPVENPGPRLIDTVDYVISVSGGGFTAGALLLATQPSRSAPEKPRVSQRFEDGSAEFDHFRRHSSYIADSPAQLIRALAEVLKNLLASMLILFTVPVLLGWVTGYLLANPHFSFAAFVPVPQPQFDTVVKPKHPDYLMSLVDHPASWWAVVLFGVLAVALAMSAIFVEWLWWGPESEVLRRGMLSVALGSAVFALLVLTVTAGLPALMRLCSMISVTAGDHAGKTAATITGVVGLNYLTALVAMAWKKRGALPLGEMTRPSWWKRILPPEVLQLTLVLLTLAVLALVWLVTLGSFAAGVFRQVTINGYQATLRNVPNWQLWLGGLALIIVFLGMVDVTSLSLHPFYRRRLAGTFAVRRVADLGRPKHWRAQPYPVSEWTWLPHLGHVPAGGPRFVFAAAATLSGQAKPAPGLNAVSYVLSADYVGGPALGWFKTPALFDEAPPRIKRDLTVQASMAISGAAFASAMGRQDKGFEKLLAVSGARLGTWLPNPKFVSKLSCTQRGDCEDKRDNSRPWPKSLPTIRGAGYFYRELFGMNYADARLVQLSDGGHYENLGLVEALRRRCRLIFCVDGGGDTPPLLSGLGDAMRLAEYELGVEITLDNRGDYAVDNIAPGSGKPFPQGHALVCLNNRLTSGTVVAGSIAYPAAAGLPDSRGTLIFAKAVLWQGCPEWLLTYAASSAVFPHDATSDQWFTEGQFAAYTQLGRIMGTHAMECVRTLRNAGRL